jgi:hypothetical protein
MIGCHMGGKLETAQPSPQADQISHLPVLESEHRVFDIFLSGIQFHAQALPVIALAQIEKSPAAAGETLTGAQGIGFSYEGTPSVDDQLLLACDRGNESIGNHRSELQGRLESVGKTLFEIKGADKIERRGLKEFQIREDLSNQWGREFIDSKLLAQVLRGALIDRPRLMIGRISHLGMRRETHAKQNDEIETTHYPSLHRSSHDVDSPDYLLSQFLPPRCLQRVDRKMIFSRNGRKATVFFQAG